VRLRNALKIFVNTVIIMSNYILFIEITSKIELKIEKLKCKKSGGDRRDEKVRELIEFIIQTDVSTLEKICAFFINIKNSCSIFDFL